jgi:hypothetical protein
MSELQERQNQLPDSPVIYFIGLGVGTVRLRKDYATPERLGELFGYDDPILIVDPEGEEASVSDLQPTNRYTVVTEADMDDDSVFMRNPESLSVEERIRFQQYIQHRLAKMQAARIQLIRELYTPKHPHLYTLDPSIFHPQFRLAFEQNLDSVLNLLHQETPTKIFSFSMFNEQFCSEFVEEIEK